MAVTEVEILERWQRKMLEKSAQHWSSSCNLACPAGHPFPFAHQPTCGWSLEYTTTSSSDSITVGDEECFSLSLVSYMCLPGLDPNIIHTHFPLHSRVKEPSLLANRTSRFVSSCKTFQLFLCSIPINFMSTDSLQYWSLKKESGGVLSCGLGFFLITHNN